MGVRQTSFINLILKRLQSNNKNLVIEFNPWNFSNQNELIKVFFDSIIEKLNALPVTPELKKELKKVTEKTKNYRSKLLKYKEREISPSISVSFFILIGFITFRMEKIWRQIEKVWKWGSDQTNETLEGQRHDIGELIRGTEKRLVIVIDDIDRLDSEETKLILNWSN